MSIHANVDARRLDQRIRLERTVLTQNSTGERVPSFRLLTECWAAVDAEKANSERYVAGGLRSTLPYTFWIRADVFVRVGLIVSDRVRLARPTLRHQRGARPAAARPAHRDSGHHRTQRWLTQSATR